MVIVTFLNLRYKVQTIFQSQGIQFLRQLKKQIKQLCLLKAMCPPSIKRDSFYVNKLLNIETVYSTPTALSLPSSGNTLISSHWAHLCDKTVSQPFVDSKHIA